MTTNTSSSSSNKPIKSNSISELRTQLHSVSSSSNSDPSSLQKAIIQLAKLENEACKLQVGSKKDETELKRLIKKIKNQCKIYEENLCKFEQIESTNDNRKDQALSSADSIASASQIAQSLQEEKVIKEESRNDMNSSITDPSSINIASSSSVAGGNDNLSAIENNNATLTNVLSTSTKTSSTEDFSVIATIIDVQTYFEDKKPFTIYVIEVRQLSNSWIIKIRYSHFARLNEQLKKQYPNIKIPSFPGKSLFGTMSKETIDKRKIELGIYLQKLLKHPILKNSTTLKNIIDPQLLLKSEESLTRKSALSIGDDSSVNSYQSQSLSSSISNGRTLSAEGNTLLDTTSSRPSDISASTPVISPKTEFNTKLFEACEAGDLNSVKELLMTSHGNVNVWKQENEGILTGPLRIACKLGKTDLVVFLILQGANVNAKDNYGRTCLHYECLGHLNSSIVVTMGNSNKASSKSSSSSPEFHLDLIRILLKYGADRWIQDSKGLTPVDLARKSHIEHVFQGIDYMHSKLYMQQFVWDLPSQTWIQTAISTG